ncbi:DUF4260 domain-containing protein [Aquisalibacillus elongatus]|uniref:Uncharacterized protein DUF4260 n=1 Tax=Aquisalibacillus elongatus TaxID=485577 RepID=A0A3N5C2J3_9BACI|nr:DUF4260 domain-containing protein [Aquisalibacillus elongatus]RPF50391.1 uncharacterized protein DUF4260 [Aquisalibacillus elongatus]
MNKTLLHLEGAAALLLTIYIYYYFNFNWVWFFALLLAPDLSMLGYLISQRMGTILYNLVHTYILSVSIIICGLLFSSEIMLALGLIWSAHIGMDRMVGYGLKYPTSFKHTHLNRV